LAKDAWMNFKFSVGFIYPLKMAYWLQFDLKHITDFELLMCFIFKLLLLYDLRITVLNSGFH